MLTTFLSLIRSCIKSTFLVLLVVIPTVNASTITTQNPKKIVLLGAGYVGLVSGSCLAYCGHTVTFVDLDAQRVDLINQKTSPINEPGLQELIAQGIDNGNLTAQSALGAEILDADIAMIAVATPTSEDGVAQLDAMRKVLSDLNAATAQRTTPLPVAIRSTILPTALRALEKEYIDPNSCISLVVNPEFLRESTAIEDFLNPPFCVVGGDDATAVQTVLSLYENISPKLFAVTVETGCLLKYACNAFHAIKVSFANEIATICDSLEITPVELMNLFVADTRLNCSAAYLKPGFSFGGSCLKKDLLALVSFAKSLGESLPLLSAAVPSNRYRFNKGLDAILQGNHRRLAILGISFKKNSDDLRDSPFVELIERLIQEEIVVQVFDPDVTITRLTGDSRAIATRRIDGLSSLMHYDLESVLDGCDGVVLCKNLLSSTLAQQLQEANIPIYDLGYFLTNQSA